MAYRGGCASAPRSRRDKRHYCAAFGCSSTVKGGFARAYERNRHCASLGHESGAANNSWKFYVCDACPGRVPYARLDKFRPHAEQHSERDLEQLIKASTQTLKASRKARSYASQTAFSPCHAHTDRYDASGYLDRAVAGDCGTDGDCDESSEISGAERDSSQSSSLIQTSLPVKQCGPTTPFVPTSAGQFSGVNTSDSSAWAHLDVGVVISPRNNRRGASEGPSRGSGRRNASVTESLLPYPCVWYDAHDDHHWTSKCPIRQRHISQLGDHFDHRHAFRCCFYCFREDFSSLQDSIDHRNRANSGHPDQPEDCTFRCVTETCHNFHCEPVYLDPCGHGQEHPGRPARTARCDQAGCRNFDQPPRYDPPCPHGLHNSKRDIWREYYRLQRNAEPGAHLPYPTDGNASQLPPESVASIPTPQPDTSFSGSPTMDQSTNRWAESIPPDSASPFPGSPDPRLVEVQFLQDRASRLHRLACELRGLVVESHPVWDLAVRQRYNEAMLTMIFRATSGHNQADGLASRIMGLQTLIQDFARLIDFPTSRTNCMWIAIQVKARELLDDPPIHVDSAQEMPCIQLQPIDFTFGHQTVYNPAGEGPSHVASPPNQQPFSHTPFAASIDEMVLGDLGNATPPVRPYRQFIFGSADFTLDDIAMQDEEPPANFPYAPLG